VYHRAIIVAVITSSLFLGNNLFGQDMLADQSRIVFLGDSITQAGAGPNGYVTITKREIAKMHPDRNIEIIGAGISGNKVPDLQRRLKRDVLDKNPTLVFIYIGINDVWHSQSGKGTSTSDYESGLRDIIKQVNDAGAKVILCTPSMIGEKTDGSNDLDSMLEEYSAISRKVATETGSQILDLRNRFIEHLKANNPLNRPKNILTRDGVHLNQAGNDFVARQMLDALGQKYESSADKSLIRHVVLFKFRDDVQQTAIDEIVTAFGELPDKIDQIIDYEAGTNVSPEQLDQGYTHVFVVTFRDAAARDAYLPHPAHKAFVEVLGDRLDKVLVIDFATK
jgi:lysophospholipase L1-like esterase